MVGRDQAALLRNVCAEVATQGRMQQMRRAVVRADAVAPLAVHHLMDAFADRQLPFRDLGAQHVKLAELLGSVLNFSDEAFESS